MRSNLLIILLIKLCSLLAYTSANEVLGCGGFIKSHAEIDFSKVEIKLLTKQGSLKDKTDCSPSNGYYFLPIYDKGEYLLRISPPSGWSFEPSQVELNFDGKTDVCSLGKDVNFVFKGFGITGKVSLAGRATGGARGVNVQLRSDDGGDVRKTTTDVNGIFSFTPIIPGKYVISASHERWHFSKAEHTVVVVSGNTELPENSLVVGGFDVMGRFDSGGQQASGLGVAIFHKKGQNLPMKCHRGMPHKLTVNNDKYESSSACSALADKSGDYTFVGVPPGNYLLQPFVQNVDLKIHIAPAFIEFELQKDTLQLSEQFKITGFTVGGQVLSSSDDNAAALSAAIIKLNGQKVTQTDANGKYYLESLKAGTYTLHVEAPQLQFNEQQIKIQLSTPNLPTITPSAYEVCGKVISKKSYVVGITKHGSTFHTTASSKSETGEWCTFLPAGKFSIQVLTTDADKSSGVQFFPLQQNIEVKSKALSGITFSQLRATINGELKCLPDAPSSCTEADVTLHTLDAQGQTTGQKQTTKAKKGKYTFTEVLPGPYEISIPQSNLCFDSSRVLLNVASASETAPEFVHKGYEVSIIASHRSIMKYTFQAAGSSQTNTSPTESMKLLSGVNSFCVSKFGTYNIRLEGCHLFDDNLPKSFNTADSSPVMINAIAHKLGVRVLSSEADANGLMKLNVESQSLGKKQISLTSESHKVDGKFAYRFDTHLKSEEVLRITPQSEVLLFTPSSKEIVGGNDCVDIAFNFVAVRGLILRGKVQPAIKDAKITMSFPKNPELNAQTTMTLVNGEFKFGPIDEQISYELSAEKESYVFSAYNTQTASFNAHKLCEIIVRVKDDAGMQLGGVLLSLSGGESYRKNLVTGDNGAINFHSLSPSQYFLRPMMKEYKFEPNSKMIELKDGETVEVELIGKRVAYSVFGTVTSLNGEPFGQLNIEATADEACMHHQEEATSEASGQYRLRGLQPGCSYTIKAKDVGASNSNVDRTIPESRSVTISSEDIKGVNLIAISPITFVDVSARVTAPLLDQYKTLRVIMYRKGSSDSPIYSQRVETPLNSKSRYNPGIMIFFPRIPLDGKTYYIELRSTLSDKTYTYTPVLEQFVADTGSVFVELNFKPEVRTAEPDLNQNSISALILVALVAIAYFKQDIAMNFVSFMWSRINGIAQDVANKQKSLNKKETRRGDNLTQREIEQIAQQIDAIKKKKTKKI